MTATIATVEAGPTLNASQEAISAIREYLDNRNRPDMANLISLVRHNAHNLAALTEIRDLALEAAIQADYRNETVSGRYPHEGVKTFADVAVEAFRNIKIHENRPVTWDAFSAPERK
jgi:hypothetical protein